MRNETTRSINRTSNYPSLCLLAAAICLCPAAAQALHPTSTATGTGALANETTGANNTADGYLALNQTTTGVHNTGTGNVALLSNTSGSGNTANGAFALRFNTTGNGNTASGDSALFFNTTGFYNTASGLNALINNTTGFNNTASGRNALYSNTTGDNNTAVGAYALNLIQGRNNIALGIKAGRLTNAGNSNIYIGNAGINGSESRVMRIGQAQTKTFVAGIAGTALSGATVVVRSNGQLGVVASSARYKQDIKPLAGATGDVADKLRQLRPVSYRYRAEPQATHYGLIAEEVDRVMPELVVRDGEQRPESVQYQELIPLLLQQWKAQQAEIARQRALIVRQQSRLDRQEAALTELHRMLATRLAVRGRADKEGRAESK
jgi:trimeric autotransporter adhesin